MSVLDFGASNRARKGADSLDVRQLVIGRWFAYGIAILIVVFQLAAFFTHRDLDGSDEQFARLFGLGGWIVGNLLGQIIKLNRRLGVLERQVGAAKSSEGLER